MKIPEDEQEKMIANLSHHGINSNLELLQYLERHRLFRSQAKSCKRNVAKLQKIAKYLGREKYKGIISCTTVATN